MLTHAYAVVPLCLITLATVADGPPEGWVQKRSINFGLTITAGNSETLQANASLLASGDRERVGSVRTGAEANYAQSTVSSNTETTVENARFFVSGRRMLSPRAGMGANGTIFHDAVAKIDYRGTLGIGMVFFPIRTARSALLFEAGPSYVWEEVAEKRDDYLAARFGERFEHEIGERSRIWQWAEYLPKSGDFADYLVNVECGVEGAISERLNLRIVIQEKHDSSPGAGLKRNDMALISGMGLSW